MVAHCVADDFAAFLDRSAYVVNTGSDGAPSASVGLACVAARTIESSSDAVTLTLRGAEVERATSYSRV